MYKLCTHNTDTYLYIILCISGGGVGKFHSFEDLRILPEPNLGQCHRIKPTIQYCDRHKAYSTQTQVIQYTDTRHTVHRRKSYSTQTQGIQYTDRSHTAISTCSNSGYQERDTLT